MRAYKAALPRSAARFHAHRILVTPEGTSSLTRSLPELKVQLMGWVNSALLEISKEHHNKTAWEGILADEGSMADVLSEAVDKCGKGDLFANHRGRPPLELQASGESPVVVAPGSADQAVDEDPSGQPPEVLEEDEVVVEKEEQVVVAEEQPMEEEQVVGEQPDVADAAEPAPLFVSCTRPPPSCEGISRLACQTPGGVRPY